MQQNTQMMMDLACMPSNTDDCNDITILLCKKNESFEIVRSKDPKIQLMSGKLSGLFTSHSPGGTGTYCTL